MSKSVTDSNPLLLGLEPDNKSSNQERVIKTSTTSTGNPLLRGLSPDKKKDVPSDSGNGSNASQSPSQLPSTSNVQSQSGSQIPTQPTIEQPDDGVYQRWHDQKVTSDDVKRMAQTDFGKKQGLDHLTESGYSTYAQIHNHGSVKDLSDKVHAITDNFQDLLYQAPNSASISAFDNAIDMANKAKRYDLVGRVNSGDVDAINQFKNQTVNTLQGKLAAVQSQARQQDQTRTAAPVIADPAIRQQVEDSRNQQATELKQNIAKVKGTLDPWIDHNLVKQALAKPGGVYNSDNVIEIGRQKRKMDAVNDVQFGRQERMHDPEAITERNYLDNQEGLRAVIASTSMSYAGDYKNYLQTGDSGAKVALDDRGNQVNRLLKEAQDLDYKYLPVQAYKVGREIQDKVASNNKAFNVWISEGDVDEAVSQLDKEAPGYAQKNKVAIDLIKKRERMGDASAWIDPIGAGSVLAPKYLARQGFIGGIETGIQSGLQGVAHGIEDVIGMRGEDDRTADEFKEQFSPKEAGTASVGRMRSNIVVGKDGDYFRESPNEDYNKYFNFNSAVNSAGQFAGNIAIYSALTEGLGESIGAAGNAVGKVGNAIGKEVNAQVAASVGMDGVQASKLVKPFSVTQRAKETAGLVSSTYAMNYDANLNQAEKEIPGTSAYSDFKRGLMANLLTVTQAATMRILPPNALLRDSFIKGITKDAVKFLSDTEEFTPGALAKGLTKKMTTDWLEKNVAPRLLNYGKQVAQTAGKANAEMVLMNHSNAIINSMFDETGETKKSNVWAEDLNTIKDVTLGTMVMSLPHILPEGMKQLPRDALYDAVLNKDENIERIRGMMEDGSMDREKGNGIIKLINTGNKHLDAAFFGRNEDGTPFSTNQTKRAVADLTSRDILEEHIKANPNDKAAKEALNGVNNRLGDLAKESPYEPLANSETLKAIGVKTPDEIDPTKEYKFDLKNEPVGFDKKQVEPIKNEDGETSGYTVTASGADVLAHLPNSEINETQESETPENQGENAHIAQGQVAPDQKAKEAEDLARQNPLKISSDVKTALENGVKNAFASLDENGKPIVEETDFDKDDASVELDRLENLAKKGKLTSKEFQKSYFGQRTDSTTLQGAFKLIESDPVKFISDLRSAFEGKNEKSNNNETQQEGKPSNGEGRGIQEEPQNPLEVGRQDQEPKEQAQGNAPEEVLNEQGVPRETEKEPAEAESAGPSFEEDAQEMKENHQDAIRMIERRADKITSYDLDHPEQVKEDVLKNIAAKEKSADPLTDSEQKIADARRADIDDIKVNDQEKRFRTRLSDSEVEKSDNLRKRVKLIDKFGIDDVVKKLIDNGKIEKICG